MDRSEERLAGLDLPLITCNTAVIGSGAASLNAAVHLFDNGVTDVIVVTERLGKALQATRAATSKPITNSRFRALCRIRRMRWLRRFSMGCDARRHSFDRSNCLSIEFSHLVAIGVPFPHNQFGASVGYKTDHDPRAGYFCRPLDISADVCKASCRGQQAGYRFSISTK